VSNVSHEDYRICKILNIENGEYIIESIYGYQGHNNFETFDKNYHLWTLADAKEGDVLASKDGDDILIFRRLNTTEGFSSYYDLRGKGELEWTSRNFIPATKEQCDLLFQKMKEANYEWNTEKKELKEIEQTSSWSEEDEKMVKDIIAAIDTLYYHGMVNWLKSLKGRIQPQPKQGL
jgi:hypothetical protein